MDISALLSMAGPFIQKYIDGVAASEVESLISKAIPDPLAQKAVLDVFGGIVKAIDDVIAGLEAGQK